MNYSVLLAALALLAGSAAAAPADDLKEAQKLYGQGKLPTALEKLDAYIVAQPKDPQGRFLRGLVLTEQKKTAEAMEVFVRLTEEFPELPEPYNNLAVLYASQGNYERAKTTLELAIQTHPNYAIAHENLGDVYARLAGRAYDRALQIDRNNPSARTKSDRVKELLGAQRTAP
jgi:tetratricopeptide (TPR) repeat protein